MDNNYGATRVSVWVAPLFAVALSLVWFEFADPFLAPKMLALCGLFSFWLMRSHMTRPSLAEGLLWLWPVMTGLWVVNLTDYLRALAFLCLIAVPRFLFVPLNEAMRQAFARGLAWSGLATALLTLFQAAGFLTMNLEPSGVYAGSLLGNANLTAAWLLLALMLGREPNVYWRWLGRGLLLIAILVCRSRGVYMAIVVWAWFACGSLPLAWRRGLRMSILVTLVTLLGSLAYWERAGWYHVRNPAVYVEKLAAQPPLIAEREPWFRGKRLSLLTRQILWANASHMAWDHRWVGCGLGQFRVFYPQYARSWFDDPHMTRDYRAASAHQALLDGMIQLGLPWTLLALWLGFCSWRRATEQSYRLALLLQALLALGTLNYLFPLIPMILLILYPANPERIAEPRYPAWFALLPWACVCLWSIANLWTGLARSKPERWPKPPWDHGFHAERTYAENDLIAAWTAQRVVFLADPHGPSSLQNLASIAALLGREEEPWAWEVAQIAHSLVKELHPYYQPAKVRFFNGQAFLPAPEDDRQPQPLQRTWRRKHNRLMTLVREHGPDYPGFVGYGP